MHLAEFLDLRAVPAAGVALSVTGRCPLGCAHCSTDSTPRSPQAPREALLGFAGSFARAPHPPRVALLTGGEPLLRPALVRELALSCRAAGTATMLLTGLPFAAGREPSDCPPRIAAALAAVDHVSVSLDPFHELRVPRAAVFAVLRRVLDSGRAASLHLLSAGPADAYPDEVAAAVRGEFGERVPMLVGRLAAVGRARGAVAAAPAEDVRPAPCAMAAWPVVGPDGVVRACCNQDVVDGRAPAPHLRLGEVGRDDWARVRERTLASPLLRVVRTLGAASCARCQALRGAPDPAAAAKAAALRGPVAAVQARAGAAGFVRRYGSARHAGLALLGAPRPGTERPPCGAG